MLERNVQLQFFHVWIIYFVRFAQVPMATAALRTFHFIDGCTSLVCCCRCGTWSSSMMPWRQGAWTSMASQSRRCPLKYVLLRLCPSLCFPSGLLLSSIGWVLPWSVSQKEAVPFRLSFATYSLLFFPSLHVSLCAHRRWPCMCPNWIQHPIQHWLKIRMGGVAGNLSFTHLIWLFHHTWDLTSLL